MLRVLAVAIALFVTTNFAHARDMMLTIYDDGMSCPGDCDAHVVFRDEENGTRYAHSPEINRDTPGKCAKNHNCVVCFGETDDSCMTAMYRGSGPKRGRFDFTPAFYRDNCKRDKIPTALGSECASIDRAIVKYGYDTRTNCFVTPANAKCTAILAASKAAQDADVPKRLLCLKMGEKAFNKAQASFKERRANDCNYSDASLGGKPGNRWHILLPGACRPNTYVDPQGLDCCSEDIRFAAANQLECESFFPR